MPLKRNEYLGFDTSYMIARFTMLNGDQRVRCGASAAFMDDLERSRDVTQGGRDRQFERLRDKIESMASRKFFSFRDDNRPAEILLTSRDDLR